MTRGSKHTVFFVHTTAYFVSPSDFPQVRSLLAATSMEILYILIKKIEKNLKPTNNLDVEINM